MAGRSDGDAENASLYDVLRAAILNGELRPGRILSEQALAESYAVSRTPVREALGRLEQDGVLERHGRRLLIRSTTPEEVLEIYDCRIVLEAMAAEWAARLRTDYDLVLMERALDRMSQVTDQSPAELSKRNHGFHEHLWKASHNSALFDLLERLELHVRRYPEPTVSQPGRWDRAVTEHSGILEAIRQRDAELAGKLSSAHMTAARDLRLHMIRQAEEE